jgi:cytochrome c-type biogenesis protein CcmE
MEEEELQQPTRTNKMKFIVGGILILAAIVYLIISSTKANAQYYYTVDELVQKGQSLSGRDIRVSGAVVGSTIQYDPNTLNLSFEVAHISGDNNEIEKEGGLANVLHAAVTNPSLNRIKVVYNGPRPDLLKDEAQAIMTGKLGSDGVFHADELLLKCPSRYESELPTQAAQ